MRKLLITLNVGFALTLCMLMHASTTDLDDLGQVRGISRGLIANAFGLQLGMSVKNCREKISWVEVQPKEVRDIFLRDPFSRKFSFTRPELTVVWTDGRTNASGWPNFLVGIFSTPSKLTLVDLFLVLDGHQRPLLVGRYETFLNGLTPGAKVTDVFDNAGRELAEYYQDKDGKWRVSFLYKRLKGRFMRIEVDAASGLVLQVGDVTI